MQFFMRQGIEIPQNSHQFHHNGKITLTLCFKLSVLQKCFINTFNLTLNRVF